MAIITYREAIRQALREMLKDPTVFLMGEDIGAYGGAFAVTKGSSRSMGKSASATRRFPNPSSSAPASAR